MRTKGLLHRTQSLLLTTTGCVLDDAALHTQTLSLPFLNGRPQFQYQKEKQPTSTFLSRTINWNSSYGLLLGGFLFGTEMGEGV